MKQIHTIRLTATYEQFLAQYSGKKRYNLRRQLQLLREHTDGRLRLRRCESREEDLALIDSELEIGRAAGNKIFRHSDQIPRPLYLQISREAHVQARLGLERSYILKDGERPISIMRGSHFGQTFYVRRTDHDPAYRRFSPGTTLIQLVIEDLIKDNRFKLMNLGWGHPSYEHQTAHDVRDYTLVWLFHDLEEPLDPELLSSIPLHRLFGQSCSDCPPLARRTAGESTGSVAHGARR